MIDYSDTQLPYDELMELLEKQEKQETKSSEKDRKRWEQARSFKFVGGMC